MRVLRLGLFALLVGCVGLAGAGAVSLSAVHADTSASVEVSAFVASSVSATLSTVTTDLSQLPADGSSTVIITVTLYDANQNPLAGKTVTINSNRGDVDTIHGYDGNTLTDADIATTDSNGQARFAAWSSAPGQATFTALADNRAVTLDQKPTVTFTPLPVLENLTIVVKVPGGGTLTIFKPTAKPQPPATPASSQPAQNKLVNTNVRFELSFWLFLLIIILVLLDPILIALVLYLSRRVRRGFTAEQQFDAKEKELLAKIYTLEQTVVRKTTAIEQKIDPAAAAQEPPGTPPPTNPVP